MSDQKEKKIPAFLKTVYLSNREIRLILAGLYALNMSQEEIEGTLWKKLLFEIISFEEGFIGFNRFCLEDLPVIILSDGKDIVGEL